MSQSLAVQLYHRLVEESSGSLPDRGASLSAFSDGVIERASQQFEILFDRDPYSFMDATTYHLRLVYPANIATVLESRFRNCICEQLRALCRAESSEPVTAPSESIDTVRALTSEGMRDLEVPGFMLFSQFSDGRLDD